MVNQRMEILAVVQKRATLLDLHLQSDPFRVMIQVCLQSNTVVGSQKKKTQVSPLIIVCFTQVKAGFLNSKLEARKMCQKSINFPV